MVTDSSIRVPAAGEALARAVNALRVGRTRTPAAAALKAGVVRKVLAVDDAKTVLMMETMMLRSGGYEVITANDGAEAVALARSQSPDLVLMDVVMPNMDGFEACRRIREINSWVPIVMVTTRGEAHNMRRGFEMGCTDYMTKPFVGAELLAKLRTLL